MYVEAWVHLCRVLDRVEVVYPPNLEGAPLTSHRLVQLCTAEVNWDRPLYPAPLSGSLLGRGLYALQLQPWLEAFGTDQIKVLFLEEVVQVG